jgi:hypothetical protein
VLRQGAQAAVQFHQRLADEFHAPVPRGSRGRGWRCQRRIRSAPAGIAAGRGAGRRGLGAQVAAEPDQPRAVGCRHVDRKIQRCPPILRP